jgi:hypothetical protein
MPEKVSADLEFCPEQPDRRAAGQRAEFARATSMDVAPGDSSIQSITISPTPVPQGYWRCLAVPLAQTTVLPTFTNDFLLDDLPHSDVQVEMVIRPCPSMCVFDFDRDMGKERIGWDLGFIRHQLDDLAELRAEGGWCRTDELHYQELCREERILL